MKKYLLSPFLCAMGSNLKAQYAAQLLTGPGNPSYIYLGSLAVSDASNFYKLHVNVLGGLWESYSTGVTTFYISNRDALKVDQTAMGSTNDNL